MQRKGEKSERYEERAVEKGFSFKSTGIIKINKNKNARRFQHKEKETE